MESVVQVNLEIVRMCSVPNCTEKHRAKGLCLKHYHWLHRRGTTDEKILRSPKERFEFKIEKITEAGCWIWMGNCISENGYGCMSIKGKRILAHRLSWELYNGPIPKGMLVCHHCDTPPCANPHHLFLGTYSTNTLDAINKKRWADQHGEKSGMSKLTNEQVLKIRQDSRKHEDIAKDFNIDSSNIGKIKNRITWRHI